MQRLLIHTFLLILALFIAAWLLTPAGVQAPRPPATEALALRAVVPPGNGFAREATVIRRDASGQFHLQAQVNGQEARFLVDTGADVVALTTEEAERLGLHVFTGDFQPIMQTASGVGYGARVTLDRITLGGREFSGIDAVVVEGLQVNLLGQSVLRRLGRVELRGDSMVIEHR
jgi:aspartyl protease family protein